MHQGKQEEHFVQARAEQEKAVKERIAELQAGENPAKALQESKRAHRGCGFDELFDAAIKQAESTTPAKSTSPRSKAEIQADMARLTQELVGVGA